MIPMNERLMRTILLATVASLLLVGAANPAAAAWDTPADADAASVTSAHAQLTDGVVSGGISDDDPDDECPDQEHTYKWCSEPPF